MIIARKQTLVQLTDELVELLDQRAERERKSRSALIREAVEAHLEDEIRAEIARQYREAYTRVPQTEEELAFTDWAARETFRRLAEEEGEDSW